ncbi:MAG: OmpH family outer membrane protein [Cyclobacteriaceae bacterium]|nr:OmpH family outer membrane protein [Cyclobacteriaceae bacterium]MCK5278577.1 OmpH family outer membrane protein [Cyclobacteriaceae bacterium]MCK5466943.1 OmpH family outer membrane protein [Cyclobacteriaceae bacterium]
MLKIVKNNLSIVLNVVLLIAVVVLYVLHFSGKSTSEGNNELVDSQINPENFSIAYVNSDSLLKNYDFFKDLEKQLIAKRDKLNIEYQNRAEGLQKEIVNFQSTAGNMSINQARAVEEDLRKKQQNLMMYQEQLGQQLMGEEAKMNSELYDKVSDYLRDYGLNKNLQLVLTYTKGSGVLYANDSLDITNQIIVGLNEAYGEEQNGGAIKSIADTTGTK